MPPAPWLSQSHRASPRRGQLLSSPRERAAQRGAYLPKVTQRSSHRAKTRTQGRWALTPTLLPINPVLNYIFRKESHNMVFKRFIWKRKKKKIHLRKKLGLPLPQDRHRLNSSSVLFSHPGLRTGGGGEGEGLGPQGPGQAALGGVWRGGEGRGGRRNPGLQAKIAEREVGSFQMNKVCNKPMAEELSGTG